MIGYYPTVGCMVFLRETDAASAIKRVISTLDAYMLAEYQGLVENKWLITAHLGGEKAEGFLYALEDDKQVAVFVEFDEENSIQIASRNRQSLGDVLLPHADALKQMPDATAVGIGFETSIPTGFDDASLQDAGFAVWFEKSRLERGWRRRDVYHLIGHTEQPLVGAA